MRDAIRWPATFIAIIFIASRVGRVHQFLRPAPAPSIDLVIGNKSKHAPAHKVATDPPRRCGLYA